MNCHETRRRLVDLHVYQGKRLGECARVMGLSYGRVLAQWHRVVAEVQDGAVPEEQLRDVRAHYDRILRRLIEVSLALAGKSAAHAAVALKALEALGKLHGVDRATGAGDGAAAASLADIGASVRMVSPMLVGKIERLRQMAVGGPSGSGR